MARTQIIKIYLCPKAPPIEGDHEQGDDNVVDVYVSPENANVVDCLWGPDCGIDWERGIDNFGKPNEFIDVSFNNPPDENCANCYWWQTIVTGKNPYNPSPTFPFLYSIGRKWRTKLVGEIPKNQQKDGYWVSKIPSGLFSEEIRNVLVRPGELISVYWEMRLDKVYASLMASKTFDTPLFSGGQIKAKRYDSLLLSSLVYDIEVGGSLIEDVMPTDFAQYSVGQWVQVLKQGEKGNRQQRIDVYVLGDNLPKIRNVPIDICYSGSPNLEGSFEKKSFDMGDFDKTFELSYFTGIITSIDDMHNTVDADVTVIDGDGEVSVNSYVDIPIFYHCQSNLNVEDGHRAFNVADIGVFLNESITGNVANSDLSLIGHDDKLKVCPEPYVFLEGRKRSGGDLYVTVINLRTGLPLKSVPGNDGTAIDLPCRRSDVNSWINSVGLNGVDAINFIWGDYGDGPENFTLSLTPSTASGNAGCPCGDWEHVQSSGFDTQGLNNTYVYQKWEREQFFGEICHVGDDQFGAGSALNYWNEFLMTFDYGDLEFREHTLQSKTNITTNNGKRFVGLRSEKAQDQINCNPGLLIDNVTGEVLQTEWCSSNCPSGSHYIMVQAYGTYNYYIKSPFRDEDATNTVICPYDGLYSVTYDNISNPIDQAVSQCDFLHEEYFDTFGVYFEEHLVSFYVEEVVTVNKSSDTCFHNDLLRDWGAVDLLQGRGWGTDCNTDLFTEEYESRLHVRMFYDTNLVGDRGLDLDPFDIPRKEVLEPAVLDFIEFIDPDHTFDGGSVIDFKMTDMKIIELEE